MNKSYTKVPLFCPICKKSMPNFVALGWQCVKCGCVWEIVLRELDWDGSLAKEEKEYE